MTTFALPSFSPEIIEDRVALAVREGLGSEPKKLPPWLFYDETGSRLFDEITERPEYYLTRTERGIFTRHAEAMIERAAQGKRLRIVELGAGSADKTRLLLNAAVAQQGAVIYEPVDVSASALRAAKRRIEREIVGARVLPQEMDYTRGLDLAETEDRQMVLYIGSSIGNFEPWEAEALLKMVRAALKPGDSVLLGVDQAKDESILLPAYDDAAGVTAAFNLNLLERLNRELDAQFDPESFEHVVRWNPTESRIEMHLASRIAQTVRIHALDLQVSFREGETIHTENSYKYLPGQAEELFEEAGFFPVGHWTDERGWFAVCLGRV
ncbi:MAG TPA: L-histidine N(alpha)-methyltransferase [Terracidiphilus sp.]|nr:L-histidine N(alpha)-methyltransferase [Terracidiphilus sp.]